MLKAAINTLGKRSIERIKKSGNYVNTTQSRTLSSYLPLQGYVHGFSRGLIKKPEAGLNPAV